MTRSFETARQFIGKEVEVIVDRPIGSKHPKHRFLYEANYGYIAGVTAPDGENLDAYCLDSKGKPLEKGKGIVRAIIHRLDDDDDKLVVEPKGVDLTDEEIESRVKFQEQWFSHEIVRESKEGKG